MTIAAGFLYNHGLLLCADTQFTAHFKLHGSKILRYRYDDDSKAVFVTIGHMKYARMCVQLIHDAITDLPKSERTLSKMHLILVSGIRELHQTHLFKLPIKFDVEVQLLVGFWSAQEKALGFYSTESTAVIRLYGYECLGSGEMLAHYLIRPQYRRVADITAKPRQSEQEVRQICIAGDR